MEKQHNRGQDGAGFASIKLDTAPGERYISRVRSIANNLYKIFLHKLMTVLIRNSEHPEYTSNVD